MIYLFSFLVTFCSIFLKGFQHKNVIGGHIESVAVTSYLMAAFDVLSVSIILQGGWTTALTAGTGAALGMVASIKTHDRFFKK